MVRGELNVPAGAFELHDMANAARRAVPSWAIFDEVVD